MGGKVEGRLSKGGSCHSSPLFPLPPTSPAPSQSPLLVLTFQTPKCRQAPGLSRWTFSVPRLALVVASSTLWRPPLLPGLVGLPNLN